MNRKVTITPDVLNILCADPRRHAQSHTLYEPIPTPEPPKKSFWEKVKSLCKTALKVIVSGVAVIKGTTELFKAATQLKEALA